MHSKTNCRTQPRVQDKGDFGIARQLYANPELWARAVVLASAVL